MRKLKSEKALENLLSKQNHLVVQGNDLAKAFGNLKAFEHKLLDYCFSFVKKDSLPTERFRLSVTDVLKYFDLNSSGRNYQRVAESFKTLNENTSLYFTKIRPDGKKSIIMTQLFSFIEFVENGEILFEFSSMAQPFVFDLKKNFYSFKLRDLSRVKGKYALILLKLWEANRYGNDASMTTIQGSLDEWQDWFLGEERRMTAGVFLQKVVTRAAEELEEKFNVDIYLDTKKKGRNVIGYRMDICSKEKKDPILNYDWLDN